MDVPTLAVVRGASAGQRVPVEDELWIGREADIDPGDDEISRRHAVGRPLDGSIEIRDVGSSNGTYVNGERLSGARLLAAGDSVELGQTAIKVWLPAAKPAVPASGAVSVTLRGGPLAGRTLRIEHTTTIGRESGDLVIPDEEVSRAHAVRIGGTTLVVEGAAQGGKTVVRGATVVHTRPEGR